MDVERPFAFAGSVGTPITTLSRRLESIVVEDLRVGSVVIVMLDNRCGATNGFVGGRRVVALVLCLLYWRASRQWQKAAMARRFSHADEKMILF